MTDRATTVLAKIGEAEGHRDDMAEAFLELVLLMETEGFTRVDEGGIKDALKQLGLTAHKQKGLLSILKDVGSGMGKALFLSIKATRNGAAKADLLAHLKETKITKEQVLEFILLLDMATLHLITAPLHTLGAITGWHLVPDIEKAKKDSESTGKSLQKAVRDIRTHAQSLADTVRGKVLKAVDSLETTLAGAL